LQREVQKNLAVLRSQIGVEEPDSFVFFGVIKETKAEPEN